MKLIMDDKFVKSAISFVMDLQERENTDLPLYEQQLYEANIAINNMLNAIQQGVFTKSTKERLEELEANKEEIEKRIALEKIANPKVSEAFLRFWFDKFKRLDISKTEHRKILIDTFINRLYLYDDKLVIGFNYKEGTRTISLDDVEKATDKSNPIGSDMDCSRAPKKSTSFNLSIFLSKPQAWHIITVRSMVHIISPFGAVSHHALACIYLRLDDIQPYWLMIYRNKLRMIYTAFAVISVRVQIHT